MHRGMNSEILLLLTGYLKKKFTLNSTTIESEGTAMICWFNSQEVDL